MARAHAATKESSASVSSTSETEDGSDRGSSASRTRRRGPLQAGGPAVGLGASTHELPDIQPKLTVNEPGDKYEKEAERVADAVMRMPDPKREANVQEQLSSNRIQRMCPRCQRRARQGKPLNCEECEEELRRTESSATSPAVDAETQRQIRSLQGGGKPLRKSTRSFYEPRFGVSFSDVRVHTGLKADEAARSVNAEAFTIGQDIVFQSGAYRVETENGKKLLAHELTHVLQQDAGRPSIQRACDPAVLAARTSPVFFPEESDLMEVFQGARTLSNGDFAPVAIGLVQQALVDLGYDLGSTGRRNDGVDRDFGPNTATGVQNFQSNESLAGVSAGVVDQKTLRCLDEIRSKEEVPQHQTGTVAPEQYRVEGQRSGGRDEDIFFERGSSTLDAEDKTKISQLATDHKGCQLELEGFISEDERVDFGTSLVDDRLDAVDAEFAADNHGDPGVCPTPASPLRVKNAHPNASSGVSSYRLRRKVEVVPPGESSETLPCPPGAPQFRNLTASEDAVLTDAIDDSRDWLDNAVGKLTPGHPEGDPALNAYFGGTGRRSTIKNNLKTWRDHVDNVVRTNNRHGTQCNAVCDSATAFNNGTGASAQMTVCEQFFEPVTIHGISSTESKAFIIMHEAGHGALDTTDLGYGHRRLIEFLSQYPTIAENNTDSYTLMVLCLNGKSSLCAPPGASDTTAGMNPAEEEKARRGLAWLETWLTWSSQDTSSLYRQVNIARQSGQDLSTVNSYYNRVFETLIDAFDIHRAPGDAPPTFREKTTVAAIRDRLSLMQDAAHEGLEVEKDTTPPLKMRWESGGPRGAPGRKVYLIDAYFNLTNDRDRVEELLPLLIDAADNIEATLEPKYETFIKENVRNSRNNRP